MVTNLTNGTHFWIFSQIFKLSVSIFASVFAHEIYSSWRYFVDLTLNLLLLTQDWKSFTSFSPVSNTILCQYRQMYFIIFDWINNSMSSPNLKTSLWMKCAHLRKISDQRTEPIFAMFSEFTPLSSVAVCLFAFIDTGRILPTCIFLSKLCPLQSILIQLSHKYFYKLSWLSSIQNVQWPSLPMLTSPLMIFLYFPSNFLFFSPYCPALNPYTLVCFSHNGVNGFLKWPLFCHIYILAHAAFCLEFFSFWILLVQVYPLFKA